MCTFVLSSHLQDGGHGGLHPAGFINTGLGLKIASGLHLQTFVRSSRDAGAEAESLFETSAKPVQEKDRLVSFSLVYSKISLVLGLSFNLRIHVFLILSTMEVLQKKNLNNSDFFFKILTFSKNPVFF